MGQRRREVVTKCSELAQRVLGVRFKDMVFLVGLATDPAKQGRGYGSALVQHVTTRVSAEPRRHAFADVRLPG